MNAFFELLEAHPLAITAIVGVASIWLFVKASSGLTFGRRVGVLIFPLLPVAVALLLFGWPPERGPQRATYIGLLDSIPSTDANKEIEHFKLSEQIPRSPSSVTKALESTERQLEEMQRDEAPDPVELRAHTETVSVEAKTKAIAEILKQIYAEPENGLIRSSFPPTMNVQEPSAVVVEIRGPDLAQLKNLPPLQDATKFSELKNSIRIGNTMSVSLKAKDPQAFEITSDDGYSQAGEPVTKPIASNGLQQWTWTVKPVRSGTQTLLVNAYITVPVPGEDVPPLQVYEKTQVITIPVVPIWTRTWWKARDALRDHWLDALKWSWTAFFVPLGVWLWKKIRKVLKKNSTNGKKTHTELLHITKAKVPERKKGTVPTGTPKAG